MDLDRRRVYPMAFPALFAPEEPLLAQSEIVLTPRKHSPPLVRAVPVAPVQTLLRAAAPSLSTPASVVEHSRRSSRAGTAGSTLRSPLWGRRPSGRSIFARSAPPACATLPRTGAPLLNSPTRTPPRPSDPCGTRSRAPFAVLRRAPQDSRCGRSSGKIPAGCAAAAWPATRRCPPGGRQCGTAFFRRHRFRFRHQRPRSARSGCR
mmetsp:Transcript_26382/g.66548  ORF Transcript_26382/g.66548 Transcript_26382/m.66548 type:complete len:206 (+) Transcript_26382:449-1066(+)